MKKIIFDTDIGGDCDDAGALAIIQEAQKLGLCELLGVVISTPRKATAGTVDAINRWYGNVVPVGQTDVITPDDDGSYWKGCHSYNVCHEYENSYGEDTAPETAVHLLRRLLAANTGVTIVITGYMTNVARLLKSDPDDISPLTGKELVNKSVEKMYVMAGEYVQPDHCENNIYCDIPMAIEMFKDYEGYMDLLGATEGRKIKTGKPLLDQHNGNPVARSYFLHSHGEPRESWDPITAFAAIYGGEDIISFSEPGTVTLDENGFTTFTPSANGKHRIMTLTDLDKATKRIDKAMCGTRKVIFDTDIGTDPDDAGALAILQEAHKKGVIDLIGISISTSKQATAGCVDAINRYYGHTVPLGQTRLYMPNESNEDWKDLYAYAIAHQFENSYGDALAEDDGVTVLRKLLAKNDHVTLLVTGNFSNIGDLIDSKPDSISPLSGKELLNTKVDRIVAMGGEYVRPNEHEYNIYCNIEAAQKTFSTFTGYIDALGFTEGCKLQSGTNLFEKDFNNPAGQCYWIHLKGNGNDWDPIPAFVTCYGTDGVFNYSDPGTITINELGYAFYNPTEGGKHRIITVIEDTKLANKHVNDAMSGTRE